MKLFKNSKRFTKSLLCSAFALTLAMPAVAQQTTQKMNTNNQQPNTQKISEYEDGSMVTIAGNISELSDDEFRLNVAGESIKVEMDDWDIFADETDFRKFLKNGQKVVVSGEIDKDWFSEGEIEANNIYFREPYSYYYVIDTNPAYETEFKHNNKAQNQNRMEDGSYVTIRGEIESISGSELVINSKGNRMQVGTAGMTYNPFNEQDNNLAVGDDVYVYGEIDDSFFDEREISADVLVKINRVGQQNSSNNMNQTLQTNSTNS